MDVSPAVVDAFLDLVTNGIRDADLQCRGLQTLAVLASHPCNRPQLLAGCLAYVSCLLQGIHAPPQESPPNPPRPPLHPLLLATFRSCMHLGGPTIPWWPLACACWHVCRLSGNSRRWIHFMFPQLLAVGLSPPPPPLPLFRATQLGDHLPGPPLGSPSSGCPRCTSAGAAGHWRPCTRGGPGPRLVSSGALRGPPPRGSVSV
jgi:hypothetical protein